MNHPLLKKKPTPSGYSIFTRSSFDKSKNKLNYYRGKDCMKKLRFKRTCYQNNKL